MSICRVVYKPDNSVVVLFHAPKSKYSIGEAFTRMIEKCGLGGLPYDDIDKSELPSNREDRRGWERHPSGKGIKVNKAKSDQEKDKEKQQIRTKKLEAVGLTESDLAKIKAL